MKNTNNILIILRFIDNYAGNVSRKLCYVFIAAFTLKYTQSYYMHIWKYSFQVFSVKLIAFKAIDNSYFCGDLISSECFHASTLADLPIMQCPGAARLEMIPHKVRNYWPYNILDGSLV